MLTGGIVAVVVVVALTVGLLTRRLAHDDVHSVEGYHRSIHTLESINTHPVVPTATTGSGSGANPAHSESALRLAATPSVRVTDAPTSSAPSGRPLPVTHSDAPLLFDDAAPSTPPVPMERPVNRDRAMSSINHRPRRLAAPAAAVAVVAVLVVVLVLTGSHAVAPRPRHHAGSSSKSTTPRVGSGGRTTTAHTTSTTSPPVVVPQSSTARSATYAVSGSTFTLTFSATSGACWIDATSSISGATLFTGTLEAGQQRSIAASGPVTVVLGAPTVMAVSVDGGAVALPSGFRTPFTMKFATAG
jgi:hypothetical protein